MYTRTMYLILLMAVLVATTVQVYGGQACEPCSCYVDRTPFGYFNHGNCSGRGLKEIPNLPNDVVSLDLSFNEIDSRILNSVCDFKSLKVLSISYNLITEFNDSPFEKCNQLLKLDMSGNNLLQIKNKSFLGLDNLKELAGLQSEDIEAGAFRNMKSLESLEFKFLGKHISDELFSGLSLKTVKLTLHALKEITSNLFDFGSKSLHSLILRGHNVTVIEEDLFKHLSVLRKVHLLLPNLETPPESIFSTVNDANTDGLGPLGLQEIVLSGMNSLPGKLFHQLENLLQLEIHDVHEIAVEGLFKNLFSLKSLNMTDSNIVKIPPEWFSNLYSLTVLNMSRCNLHSIEENSLLGLVNLKTLDISMNAIRAIPKKTFSPLRDSIDHLRIRGNMLKYLDDSLFRNMHILRILDLSDNKIANITVNAFSSLTLLNSLYLQENKLYYLPVDLLKHQVNLQLLDLGKNSFRRIPISVMRSAGFLRRLSLPDNKLVSIPPSLPDELPFLEYLNLKGNNLRCKCRLFRIRVHKPKLYIDGHCSGGSRHVMSMEVPIECGGPLLDDDIRTDVNIPPASSDYDYKGQYDYYAYGYSYVTGDDFYSYETETDHYYDIRDETEVIQTQIVTETMLSDVSVIEPITVTKIHYTSINPATVRDNTVYTSSNYKVITTIVTSSDAIYGSTTDPPFEHTTPKIQPTKPLSNDIFSSDETKSKAIVSSTISEEESSVSLSKVLPSHSSSISDTSIPAPEGSIIPSDSSILPQDSSLQNLSSQQYITCLPTTMKVFSSRVTSSKKFDGEVSGTQNTHSSNPSISPTSFVDDDVSIFSEGPGVTEVEGSDEPKGMSSEVKGIVGFLGIGALVCICGTLWWLKNQVARRRKYEVTPSSTVV